MPDVSAAVHTPHGQLNVLDGELVEPPDELPALLDEDVVPHWVVNAVTMKSPAHLPMPPGEPSQTVPSPSALTLNVWEPGWMFGKFIVKFKGGGPP